MLRLHKEIPPQTHRCSLSNTCEHPRHEVPTIWHTEDLSLQLVGKLLPNSQYPLFVRGVGDQCDPPSLILQTYHQHTCTLCEDLDEPLSKSIRHHTMMKCEKTKHLSRTVTPPKPLPTEWEYKPPPIFTPPTCKLTTAITLQQLLEYGLSFQLPQESTATPFLSNFHACLNLETNNPPLTHFQTTHRHTRTYTKYQKLLQTLKRDLKTNTHNCLRGQRTRTNST